MTEKETISIRVYERHDRELDEAVEAFGQDRSYFVRRALDYYFSRIVKIGGSKTRKDVKDKDLQVKLGLRHDR